MGSDFVRTRLANLFLVPPTQLQVLDSAVAGFGRTGLPSRGLSPRRDTFF